MNGKGPIFPQIGPYSRVGDMKSLHVARVKLEHNTRCNVVINARVWKCQPCPSFPHRDAPCLFFGQTYTSCVLDPPLFFWITPPMLMAQKHEGGWIICSIVSLTTPRHRRNSDRPSPQGWANDVSCLQSLSEKRLYFTARLCCMAVKHIELAALRSLAIQKKSLRFGIIKLPLSTFHGNTLVRRLSWN